MTRPLVGDACSAAWRWVQAMRRVGTVLSGAACRQGLQGLSSAGLGVWPLSSLDYPQVPGVWDEHVLWGTS
jgi:hypothetical protein